ncbi:MAG: hypothetical protein INQ03_08510 [Candidatus Heimdallarchaeota archaeon]|nr:hypothetical protein [Candidatus Heimdallarchaeota archaeon]
MAKYHNQILIGALAMVILLIASPAAAAPSYNVTLTTDSLDDSFSIEYLSIVPGLDLATYTSVFSFGGHDGSAYPVDDSASGLAETGAWLLMYANLDNFNDYLNRIPMESPTGLTLMLLYPQGVSGTFTKAANALAQFNTAYGVDMELQYFESGTTQDDFYVFYSAADVFGDVADDVNGVLSSGFTTLMDPTKVTEAPAGWAGYGVRDLAGYRIGMHGVGWVSENGLTKSGDVYTLSSDNILGMDVVPASTPDFGLSRVMVNFPYPIAPVANGITPATSNPLPHVTGQMVWDLRHPIADYELEPADNYEVKYELTVSPDFPNIQNRVTIDQNKLNQEGTLEVKFDLENIGEATATDVLISFPLGPDFEKIAEQELSIYTIADGYTLDTTKSSTFSVVGSATGIADTSFGEVLTLDGWYVDGNGDYAEWNSSITSITLFDDAVPTPFGDIQVSVKVDNPEGFPIAFVNAIEDQIIPNMPAGSEVSGGYNEIFDAVKANLEPALKQAFNESFTALYDEKNILLFDEGDFQVVLKEVGISADETEFRYFLEANIASMAPDATETLMFTINNVPTTNDTLALMAFQQETNPEGYPHVTLTSEVQDYVQFMQYAFQMLGFDGRPLSFNLEDGFEFGLDGFLWSSTLASLGAVFTYSNEAGYPFFGMTNGQNLQIADNEAVIAATLELDQQNYVVGDPVEITVDLFNNGDSTATDIIVNLFHGTIGRDWQFERIDQFAALTADDLAAGGSDTVTFTGEANTYLGYHTVFAVVEFTSDAGETPATLPDFLDMGITAWEGAGEARHFTMSTLSGALVLPEGFLPEPSIPEPLLVLTTEIIGEGVSATELSAGEEFDYKITITNDGDAETDAIFTQNYDDTALEVVNVATTEGTSSEGNGYVEVDGMNFAPGETITITITFKLVGDSATLPPGVITYSTEGDSSLGTQVNTGVGYDVSSNAADLSLSADSAAQSGSSRSGSEDGSSSSFSARSSVGASVETEDLEQETVAGPGFVGFGPEFLALMLIPLAGTALIRRRK